MPTGFANFTWTFINFGRFLCGGTRIFTHYIVTETQTGSQSIYNVCVCAVNDVHSWTDNCSSRKGRGAWSLRSLCNHFGSHVQNANLWKCVFFSYWPMFAIDIWTCFCCSSGTSCCCLSDSFRFIFNANLLWLSVSGVSQLLRCCFVVICNSAPIWLHSFKLSKLFWVPNHSSSFPLWVKLWKIVLIAYCELVSKWAFICGHKLHLISRLA